MIYKFAHGVFRDHIVDCLKVRGSTIRKYIDIVCDSLVDGQNLFSQCINGLIISAWLENVICSFMTFIRLSNVFVVINETHIPLANCLSCKITLSHAIFSIGKKSSLLFWKGFAMLTRSCRMFIWVILAREGGGWGTHAQWWLVQSVQLIQRFDAEELEIITRWGQEEIW